MAGSEVKADLWVTEYISPWDFYSYGVERVLAYQRTPYQEMYIVESGGFGKGLVLDGKWQSCTSDEFIYHETLVQPAAIAHGSPQQALVLGGGEGATIREVLRWKTIEKVTMIDIDEQVVQACQEHLPEMHQNAFDDPRVELVIGDALEVLDQSSDAHWDLIISDLSDPIEAGPSFKLFTKEYFQTLKRVLAPEGFVVVQAGPVSPRELPSHARLINTLKAVFANVYSLTAYTPAYARPWGIALACDRPMPTRPDPEAVDKLLAEKTTGGLRLIDGMTLLGTLQTPLHIRKAIEAETTVYTLEAPPKFFGKGVAAGS